MRGEGEPLIDSPSFFIPPGFPPHATIRKDRATILKVFFTQSYGVTVAGTGSILRRVSQAAERFPATIETLIGEDVMYPAEEISSV